MEEYLESFNKLVRDNIPAIIKDEGGEAETYIVEDDEIFQQILLSKLEEESLEISSADEDHLLEELGDMESVIDALLKLKGWTRQDLENQQAKKDIERGKFEKRIILKQVKRKAVKKDE
jgi:predicted house-cleaning noncanonical NTP pyrophosphatase (MazG superfamily)